MCVRNEPRLPLALLYAGLQRVMLRSLVFSKRCAKCLLRMRAVQIACIQVEVMRRTKFFSFFFALLL